MDWLSSLDFKSWNGEKEDLIKVMTDPILEAWNRRFYRLFICAAHSDVLRYGFKQVNLLSSHLDYHLELNSTDHVEIEQPKGTRGFTVHLAYSLVG
jgi:hypothetical protein